MFVSVTVARGRERNIWVEQVVEIEGRKFAVQQLKPVAIQ